MAERMTEHTGYIVIQRHRDGAYLGFNDRWTYSPMDAQVFRGLSAARHAAQVIGGACRLIDQESNHWERVLRGQHERGDLLPSLATLNA